MSRSSLVRVDGFSPLVCRAAFAPCFLSCAVGAFMISGLSLVPALMLGLPVVNPWIDDRQRHVGGVRDRVVGAGRDGLPFFVCSPAVVRRDTGRPSAAMVQRAIAGT